MVDHSRINLGMNTDSINFQASSVDFGDLAGWQNWLMQATEGLPEALSGVVSALQSNSNFGLVILAGLFASLLIFFRAANLMTSGSSNYQPSERDANAELLFTTAYKPRLDSLERERKELNIVLSSAGTELMDSELEDDLEEEDNLLVMKRRFEESRSKKKKRPKAA